MWFGNGIFFFFSYFWKKETISNYTSGAQKKSVNRYQNDLLKSHLMRFINLKRLKTVCIKDILTEKIDFNKTWKSAVFLFIKDDAELLAKSSSFKVKFKIWLN